MFKMLTNNQDEESKAAENLEVAGGICWRQKWRVGLCLTGEIFNCFPMKVIFATGKVKESCFQQKLKYFSETWILPFIVLFATLAYSIQAIAFYNSDG